jgi:hypothetical protein
MMTTDKVKAVRLLLHSILRGMGAVVGR